MDCCTTGAPPTIAVPKDEREYVCASCRAESRTVTRKTVLLMLKHECFDSMGDGEYRFCGHPECDVVYFAESGGAVFTTDDLRVRVGLKEKEDPVPLCYCFGFDEADARAELRDTGQCSIPERVSALIRRGMCACVERNPSGTCCLGEVNKAVKRLAAEVVAVG
jgi:hypothetical protein